MHKQKGFSGIELLIVALVVGLLLAIIIQKYQEAVLVERRAIAQQALYTVSSLQERWFVRMYEYAKTIDDVGGSDSAGEHFILRVTQDPCGDTSCYTVTATAVGDQVDDVECEKMSINNLGVKRSANRANKDTTSECWHSTI